MKETLELLKSVLDVVKQLAFVTFVAVLVTWPSGIGALFAKVGITEGDILDFKWKSNLKATDAELQQAQIDKDQLTSQLRLPNDTIRKQNELIVSINTHPSSAATSERVDSAVSAAKSTIDQNHAAILMAQANSQIAQQTIVQNSSLVASTAANAGEASSQWIVLAGSDTTEAAATPEVDRAVKAGFMNAKIFYNRGVYRTAIIYPDRQTAGAALPTVKDRMRQDAYLVGLNKWCPNQKETRPGFIDCGT